MHDLNRNAQDSLFPFALPFLSLNMGGCGELSFIPVCGALHNFIIEEREAERKGNGKWPEFSLFVAPFWTELKEEMGCVITNNLSYAEMNLSIFTFYFFWKYCSSIHEIECITKQTYKI